MAVRHGQAAACPYHPQRSLVSDSIDTRPCPAIEARSTAISTFALCQKGIGRLAVLLLNPPRPFGYGPCVTKPGTLNDERRRTAQRTERTGRHQRIGKHLSSVDNPRRSAKPGLARFKIPQRTAQGDPLGLHTQQRRRRARLRRAKLHQPQGDPTQHDKNGECTEAVHG